MRAAGTELVPAIGFQENIVVEELSDLVLYHFTGRVSELDLDGLFERWHNQYPSD